MLSHSSRTPGLRGRRLRLTVSEAMERTRRSRVLVSLVCASSAIRILMSVGEWRGWEVDEWGSRKVFLRG